MPGTDDTPTPAPVPDTAGQWGFCKEDWLIIDAALHRAARSLRKIEKEEKLLKLKAADGLLPANQ